MRALFLALAVICMAFPAVAEEKDYLANSLSVGDVAEDFTLPNAHGKPLKLSAFLKHGPVVLTFYRGGWCPVCNGQLHEMQGRIHEIQKLGASLVAVSPETPDNAQLTIVKNKLNFEVLSDKGNKIAKQYGILWEIPKEQQGEYSKWLIEKYGKDFKDYNGMADLDVVREIRQLENPELSESELDFYLQDTYSFDEDDEDDAKRKQISLKIEASKGRKTLNDMKFEFKNQPKANTLTPEMTKDLELIKEIKKNQELSQQSQNDYVKGIESSASNLNTLKVELPDGINIDYKVENPADTVEFLDKMPHWHNQDGSWNYEAIVSDGVKLKNMDNIIKLAFEQGKALGLEGKVKSSKDVEVTPRNIPQNDVKSDIEFLDGDPFPYKNKGFRRRK